MMEMRAKPLEERPERAKNPNLLFYCPLCRTQRGFVYSSALQKNNYLHIGMISLFLMVVTFGAMSYRVFIWPFLVWPIYEGIRKLFFRKEIPCPHCGFDMTWYRKDVKKARVIVEEFWKGKITPLQDTEFLDDENEERERIS